MSFGASVRSSQLRKLLYEGFGADLALATMHELWQQAAKSGEAPGAPTVPDMPENVVKFFEPEGPIPPWRWESVEDRAERERLTTLGG